MTTRYSLRFEAGEREGEIVPLPPSGLVIGRRPGSGLQILDSSVSGRHAEVSVDDEGVFLKDLGSTNGTRVGKSRVLETRLAHGDQVLIGNVPLRVVDAELAEPAAAPPPAKPSAAPARPAAEARAPEPKVGEPAAEKSAVSSIGADRLAKASKSSALWLVLLLVAAGGAGAYFFLNKGGGAGGNARRAVQPVAGNLLAASYSFESEDSGWTSDTGAPSEFFEGVGEAYSGDGALGADLAEGDWAQVSSDIVRATSRQRVVARAQVEADGDTRARLGVELLPAEGDDESLPGSMVAWSAVAEGGGYEELEVAFDLPRGFARCRVLVHAEGEGTCSVDDVVLLMESATGAEGTDFGDARFSALGHEGRDGVLAELDKVMLTGVRVLSAEGEPQPLTVAATARGFELSTPTAARLELRVEPALFATGFATLGASGYQPRRVEFTDESISALVCGLGGDLLRVGVAEGSSVRGRPEGNGMRVDVELAAAGKIELQLDFNSERAEAIRLADQARGARRAGRLGESLSLWEQVLDRYPYEPELVREGEEAASMLVREGLSGIRAVRESLERARFFRLVDLFRNSRAEVEALAARYAGSEVEAEARKVVEEIDAEVATLEQDLNLEEKQRLEAIHGVLQAQGAERLAGRVEAYLEREFGGGR